MGRPRGFNEAEVVRAAAALFAFRPYDGVSVDDLVSHLGVHRNSLYKTFGSKRGLYLTALRWHLEHEVGPLIEAIEQASDLAEVARLGSSTALDLLVLATVERAAADPEVATATEGALSALDDAIQHVLAARADDGTAPAELATAFTAALLGFRVRAKTNESDQAGLAWARQFDPDTS